MPARLFNHDQSHQVIETWCDWTDDKSAREKIVFSKKVMRALGNTKLCKCYEPRGVLFAGEEIVIVVGHENDERCYTDRASLIIAERGQIIAKATREKIGISVYASIENTNTIREIEKMCQAELKFTDLRRLWVSNDREHSVMTFSITKERRKIRSFYVSEIPRQK